MSRQLRRTGSPLTSAQHIHAYFSSLGLILGLLVIAIVAIIIAFGSICFGVFTASEYGQSGLILMFLISAAGIVAAILLIRGAQKWNDEQWRRMTGQKQDSGDHRNKR